MKKQLLLLALALSALPVHANTCSIRQAGSTDQTVYVTFLDATTGVPTAGLAFDASGIDLEYVRAGAAAVDITEVTQTAAGAHSDGGFVSVGHGRYRLDLPDAAVAAGVPEVVIQGTITGYIMAPCTVALSPAVNVAQFGGTNGTFSSGRPEVNTTHWGGTAVASARPLVDAVQISGDSGAADALEAAFDGTAGSAISLGIVDQGTAQSATSTTLVLRSALSMANDTAIGMTLVACGSTQGYCQARAVTDYVSSTDTATVDTWTVTPSGTITYYLFGTAPTSSSGSGATAQEVWEYGTRTLTSLGTGSGLTAIPWNSAWDAEVESEVDDALGGGTGTALTAIPWNSSWDAEVQSEATDALNAYDPPTRAELTSDTNSVLTAVADVPTNSELASALDDRLRTITGTCDSGSTTTCVDNALTQADASQLEGRLICFNDSWCGLITTFNPGTDTVTTTKTAPSTRSAKAYTIFPATLE